jgi:mannose-6-phosphate isomerase-like protein (cupin superfamily)
MNTTLRTISIAAAAFALGCTLSRLPQNASAAAAPLQPAVFDTAALTLDAFPPANPATPKLRTKTLVVADGATVAVVMGTAAKHFHAGSDEIQVVLEGSGTEWLGDKQVDVKQGSVVVIPRNTAHAGLVDTSGGKLKFVAIKTPPQDPTDVHPL